MYERGSFWPLEVVVEAFLEINSKKKSLSGDRESCAYVCNVALCVRVCSRESSPAIKAIPFYFIFFRRSQKFTHFSSFKFLR